jgi:hypothetical protein
VSGLQVNKSGNSYFEIKMSYLERVHKLLLKVREAILSSNLEALNKSLKGIEEMQIKIDNLDRECRMIKSSFSEEENARMTETLANVLGASEDNERLLQKEKEKVLSELKTIRLKKSVRNIYGGTGAGSEPMRSIG